MSEQVAELQEWIRAAEFEAVFIENQKQDLARSIEVSSRFSLTLSAVLTLFYLLSYPLSSLTLSSLTLSSVTIAGGDGIA